jgi:hypothetical protein
MPQVRRGRPEGHLHHPETEAKVGGAVFRGTPENEKIQVDVKGGKMKHTPGPWTLGNIGGYGEGGVFSPHFEKGEKPLATVRFPAKYERGTLSQEAFEEAEANARLISAALETYEALLGTVKLVETTDWLAFSLDDRKKLDRARAAIAKAEGKDKT